MIKIVVLLSSVTLVSLAAKFPSNWKKCPTKNNEECLKSAIHDAIIDLKNGNKKVHVTPLDPLHFERLELNQGGSSPVNINLTFYNLDLIGASRIKVNNAKFDMDNHEVMMDLNIVDGNSYLTGDYSITGSILVLPIRGNGKSNITFEDLNLILTLKGKDIERDGKKYFQAEETKFDLRPKKVQFYFGNLFDGVPQLGENMNKFLNDNWQEIMGELKGTISEAMGLAMKQISNNFFNSVPMNQLHS